VSETPKWWTFDEWEYNFLWKSIKDADLACSQGIHYDFSTVKSLSRQAFHINEPYINHLRNSLEICFEKNKRLMRKIKGM
jgi:hypothetical protein